jgi:predicted permease
MHWLLRLALLTCPPEFRYQYGEQLAADAARDDERVVRTALDVVGTGVALRLETIIRDITFAARSLAKAPLFSAIAIITIAVAIAANVAVASAIDGVLLKPLPYANPSQLAFIRLGGSPSGNLSFLDARDVEARSVTLSSVGIWSGDGLTLTGRGAPRIVHGAAVNASYLAVLGAKIKLGRILDARDTGQAHIVISEEAWRQFFAADVGAIGKTLRLDGKDYFIVGVLAPGFANPLPGNLESATFWRSIDPRSTLGRSRIWRRFFGIARIRSGVTVEQAQVDTLRVLRTLIRAHPIAYVGVRSVSIAPLYPSVIGEARPLLGLLDVAVTVVLLIACANVANMTIVRNAAREREIDLRSALGASRLRILAQLSTEAALLAALGGAIGLLIGWELLHLFSGMAAELIPRWEGVSITPRVLLYVLLLLGVTTMFAGMLPAWGRPRSLAGSLKDRGQGGGGRTSKRVSAALVSVEIAFAIAVVACAGLIVKSFATLTSVDVGFNGRNVTALNVALPSAYYWNDEKLVSYAGRLHRELSLIPGVRSAAIANLIPFSGDFYPHAFTIPGRPDPHATVDVNVIAGSYFETLGIPIVRGRQLDARDTARSQPVVMVNEAFAERYFGTLDVVEKRVVVASFSKDRVPPSTIVGIAGNTRDSFAGVPQPELFVPFSQSPFVSRFVIRTQGREAGLRRAIVDAAARVAPHAAAPLVQSYSEIFAEDTLRSHIAMLLFSSLAAISLILAFAGVYAVASYSVTQQTGEIGIRRAIGARTRDILGGVIKAALSQATAGIVFGFVLIALSARLLSELLFETSPFDAPTLVIVVLLLVVCSTAAALMPAIRAARIEPSTALRHE